MELYQHSTEVELRRVSRLLLMSELEPSVQILLARLGLETPGALAPKSLGQLLADLNDPAWEVRVAAVRALGVRKEKAAIEHLLAMLHDEVDSVQVSAIHTLATLERDVPVEPLVEAFCDSGWAVRTAVVSVLSQQGERVPSWFFFHALRDADGLVRAAALQALGAKGLASLDLLVDALYDDNSSHVREIALFMLSGLGEQVPRELLQEALNDLEEPVREAAKHVLNIQETYIPEAPSNTDFKENYKELNGQGYRKTHGRLYLVRRKYVNTVGTLADNFFQLSLPMQLILGVIALALIAGIFVVLIVVGIDPAASGSILAFIASVTLLLGRSAKPSKRSREES